MALIGLETKFGKVTQKIEFKLVLFLSYIGSLSWVWLATGNLRAVILAHFSFVILFSIIYFGFDFLLFLLSPIFVIVWPIESLLIRRYLKKFKQNIPTDAVIILGRSNWFTLEGWLKPNFFTHELKSLVRYLNAKKQDFSFYPSASFSDVEKVMSDKNIKEVYFFGHGNSHCFQLNNDVILYYCDFNDTKYQKEFVHQVHCGTPYGKSLVDYVVPEKNKARCFMFRKPINGYGIVREFKRKEREERI